MITLPVFTIEEAQRAKLLLAAKVASMMGRKLEEGDWSNLSVDVNYNGLGVEFKMLRIGLQRGRSIKEVCGTTKMHPAATRSIRIDDFDLTPDEVMTDILTQYADLIDERAKSVKERSPDGSADMRLGWLLWESDLREFLYFEESMRRPDPARYSAFWNETPARGARKASKSLWIFDKATGAKRYSVTTSAGIKIQPYFDVPPPSDPNLIYFRVQSEPVGEDTVVLWVSASTAGRLREILGSIDRQVVSDAISRTATFGLLKEQSGIYGEEFAVPIHVSKKAFEILVGSWDAMSDEHHIQQLIDSLNLNRIT